MRASLVLALPLLLVAVDSPIGWWPSSRAPSGGEGAGGVALAASRPSATAHAARDRSSPPSPQPPPRPTPDSRGTQGERSAVAEPAGRRGRPVTLRGEIVELAGFLREGRRGAGHRGESLAAVQAGGSLALVEDDTGDLYLLAGDTPASQPNELARDLVAEHVVATGTAYERAGCRVLVPTAVDRLDR